VPDSGLVVVFSVPLVLPNDTGVLVCGTDTDLFSEDFSDFFSVFKLKALDLDEPFEK